MEEKKSDSSDNESNAEHFQVYCSLCKMGFSGTVPYRHHLKGNNHQKAETKQFMKVKYGQKYLEAMEKMKTERSESHDELKLPVTDDEILVFTCNACEKVCTGHLPYQLHLASKKHAKQVQKLHLISALKGKMPEETAGDHVPLYDTIPQLKPFASCNVCKKTFSGPEGYQQHMNSQIHKKELQKQTLLADMPEYSQNDTDESIFTCVECDKNFSGPIPYQQHLISDVHKNKAKDIALGKQVNDKMVVDEDGYIQCSDCGKPFSGPKPLLQHLMGSAHSKQKKRDDLIQNLLDKFPEFLKISDDQESDADSDSEYLLCSICHKCFSGPESARDHFRSKKHLKTKKEKNRIDKLKEMKKAKSKDDNSEPKKSIGKMEEKIKNGMPDVAGDVEMKKTKGKGSDSASKKSMGETKNSLQDIADEFEIL